MDLCVPCLSVFISAWSSVAGSKGVFVAVDSKMRRCSPHASESIFMLLLNRILWSQQRERRWAISQGLQSMWVPPCSREIGRCSSLGNFCFSSWLRLLGRAIRGGKQVCRCPLSFATPPCRGAACARRCELCCSPPNSRCSLKTER